MLELVDRVLELLVEHAAVGDHDDTVEDLAVVVGVQAGEAVGKPGDGVALAAAGRVLDQVVVPDALGARVGLGLAHAVELVVAREDHRLAAHRLAAELPLVDLEVQEAREDVHEAVARQDLLPEVGGLVAGGVWRVAGGRAVALG